MFTGIENNTIAIEVEKILWLQSRDPEVTIIVINKDGGGLLVRGSLDHIVSQLVEFNRPRAVN